jgi:hypothetical protein
MKVKNLIGSLCLKYSLNSKSPRGIEDLPKTTLTIESFITFVILMDNISCHNMR